MLNEVDDVLYEDLEAASFYHDQLLNDTLPKFQAAKLARENLCIELDDKTLNSIMAHYACTRSTLHECVEGCLRKAGLL